MRTTQTYITDKHILAFHREKATADFWDQHWETSQLQSLIRKSIDDNRFLPFVKKYLPKASIVLEGGCGRGEIVHALQYQGYKAIGIDFARQTIEKIKEAVPELDVRYGDVRALDLADASLDGYVSVGVIEHFWEGYGEIAKEMCRTLKVGGFLFVSFPYLSLLRKFKIIMRAYPSKTSSALNAQQEKFYQFALDARKVQIDFELLGFQFKESITYDGIKGFKDEVALFKPWLQSIYDGNRGWALRPYLDRFFKPFASHMALLVMQKVK
jgi:SAM-dependent methyltransferase